MTNDDYIEISMKKRYTTEHTGRYTELMIEKKWI